MLNLGALRDNPAICMMECEAHRGTVQTLHRSPDGDRLASRGTDRFGIYTAANICKPFVVTALTNDSTVTESED